MERDDVVRIELDGTVLKDGLKVLEGEIVDAAVMRRRALDAFLEEQVADAKRQGVLFSLHMKATGMKVSGPIIFGRGVRAYFKDGFAEHELGNPNNGLGSILNDAGDEAKAAIARALEEG